MNKQKAIEYEKRELLIYRELKDRSSEANTLETLGEDYNSLGSRNRAIEMLEEAASIYRELNDVSHEDKVLVSLKKIRGTLSEQEQFEYLLKQLEASLERDRRLKDTGSEILQVAALIGKPFRI